MHFVHRGDIREHRCDRIAVSDVSARKVRGKTLAARISLRPGKDAALVNRADVIGIDGGGARQEAQRRQRHIIGRRLVQTETVLALLHTHRPSPIHAYRNPIEIHGNIATMINPTSIPSRYPQIGMIPSAGAINTKKQAAKYTTTTTTARTTTSIAN